MYKMARIPREYAKFDIKMTVTRDELDWLKSKFEEDLSPFGKYISDRLNLAEER